MTKEGFFERYFIIPFFRNYSDFSGSASGRDALLAFLAWLTVTAGVAGLFVGLVGLLGPEVGFAASIAAGAVWTLGSLCPLAALAVRTTHRSPETEDNGKPVFLVIDLILCGASFLFLVSGLLMMLTTLDSGELNGGPRFSTNREKAAVVDSVVEEPIFTYQDNTPEKPVVDTLADLVDSDTVSLSESFDPTLNASAPEEPDTISLEF